jgi:Protein of unknown function (DUF1552)
MFITKKHLSRRTLLRGAGASIALPLLDAMIPAHTALAQTAAAPKVRVGFVYFPHGAVRQFWTPKKTGNDFDFSHVLKPLEPFREGRNGRNASSQAGVTVDQHIVRHIGQGTPLPSLEMCTEPGGYTSLSYRTPTQQLEMESNPRKVFYTLFGQGDNKAERQQIVQTTGSLLDYVRDATASLNRELDAGDRVIVSDYLESVREIERRVQKLKASSGDSIEPPDAPLGAPDDFTELLDVQFELMALSWQTNQTRVTTFRMANEVSMRVYNWLDIAEAFHPLSHHSEDPEKIQRLLRVQVYHTERMAKFVRRLQGIRDGEMTLLDSAAILFGSNMANSDLHDADPVPSALIGHAAGRIKGNQHLAFPQDTPHANLLLTLAQRVGLPLEKFADSTGAFAEV